MAAMCPDSHQYPPAADRRGGYKQIDDVPPGTGDVSLVGALRYDRTSLQKPSQPRIVL